MYTVYSKEACGFCEKAKTLLKAKNLPFAEVRIFSGNTEPGVEYITADELREKIPGVRSVPQIFFDGQLVGGYNELVRHVA